MKRNYNLKIKKSIFAALLVVLTLNACQKEASEGPQGEKGEQGIAGADGSTLLSGNGEPTVSLGKTGDYYLDKTAVTIYGPKTSAGWGEATSLKGGTDGKDGANGTNGKDGSKILSGTDVPALSLGAEGDFYFDTQNVTIYGPKTSAGWGNPVSLKAQAANGVTVLLYKNHAFQSVVRNTSSDTYRQERLVSLAEEKVLAEAPIANYQEQYDQQVAGINSITDSWYTQEMKNADLAQALQNFENNTEYYREWLIRIANEKIRIEQELATGSFNVESIIPLDIKYHDIYDNGIILVQVKKANDVSATWWSSEYNYLEQIGEENNYRRLNLYVDDGTTSKNQVEISGYSSGIPESEIKAFRIDIKIVLIPATTVEVMSSKKINTKDLKAVSKYLGL